MQAWYDAADTSTFTITSNKVEQWRDKSANGHHLNQATAGSRPLYDASPRTIAGVTVPEFTVGGAEFMTSTCPADDRASTSFLVALLDTAAGSGNTPFGDSEGGGNELRVSSAGIFRTLKSGVAFLSSSEVVSLVAGQVFFFMQRLTSSLIVHDNVSQRQSFSDSTTFTAATTLRIGKDQSGTIPWDGLIAEFVRYDTTLADTDMRSTMAYLVSKWHVSL